MARRVNTKFVVILGSSLVLGAAMLLGSMWFKRWRDNDPVRLEGQAVAAETAGQKEEAYRYYIRAATESAKRHRPGGDVLYTKAGDLGMKLSGEASDGTKAEEFYKAAQQLWQLALQQNSRYLPAHHKLIEELYKTATFARSGAYWTTLENSARRLIDVDPEYANGYVYLATARVYLAIGAGPKGMDVTTLASIDEDIKRALEKDPNSGKAVVLQAQVLELRAAMATNAGLAKDAEAYSDESEKLLVGFLQKNPNDTDVVESLSTLYQMRKHLDKAVELLTPALAAKPAEGRIGAALANIYAMQGKNAEAEAVLKKLAELNPSDPDSYNRLARFYQGTGRPAEAIEAYKKVLQYPAGGGGIAVLQNRYREIYSLFYSSWLYMDVALRVKGGISSPEAEQALAESASAADRLRGLAHADRSMVELLDGRLQLVKGNVDQALPYLLRADAFYDRNPGAQEWRNVKDLLATAYYRKREGGLELKYLDQYLKHYPRQPLFIYRKARNLVQAGKPSEALALADDLIRRNETEPLPKDLLYETKMVRARALQGLTGQETAFLEAMRDIAKETGNQEVLINTAANLMATSKLDEARKEIEQVLAASPDSERALAMAIVINLRMGPERKAEAAKYLARALEKYPKNSQFQYLKGRIDSLETDTLEVQLAAVQGISDDYARNVTIAQIYIQKNDRMKALEAFGEAAKALEKTGADDTRDQLARVCDQAFALSISSMNDARYRAAVAENKASRAASAEEKSAALAEKARLEESAKTYYEQAKLYAQKAERLNLDGVGGRLFQGRLLFSEPATRNQGLALLEQTVAAQPDNSYTHTVLGVAYYEAGKSEQALTELRTAIEQKPDNVIALTAAIDLLVQKTERGDDAALREAQRYLETALKFSRNDPNLNRYLDIIGNVAEAIRKREAIRAREPNNEENLLRLARLYYRQGLEGTDRQANLTRSAEILRPIFDKQPENLRLGQTLANVYRDLQQYDAGKAVFDRLMTSGDPNLRYEATVAYGDYYAQTGLYKDALIMYQEAAEREPAGRETALARMGDLQFDLGDMAGAEKSYRKMYQKRPNIRVQYRLIEVMLNQRKFTEARAELDAILKETPGDVHAQVLTGYSLIKQGRHTDAIETYNQILKQHPENMDAMHYRAVAQFSLNGGDLAQAVKDLVMIRAASDNLIQSGRVALLMNSRVLLARVYRQDRRYAEAADEYEDVIKTLNPTTPLLRIEYARYLLALGQVATNIKPENTDNFANSIRVVKPLERLTRLLEDSIKKMPGQPMWLLLDGERLALDPRLFRQAQQRFEEAFRVSKGSTESAIALLDSLITTKDYQKAVDLASQMIQAQPGNGMYYIKRATAYSKMDKNAEAVADMIKAMDASGQDLALYLSVLQLTPPGPVAEGVVANLKQRVAEKPAEVLARVGLGQMLFMTKRPAEAVNILDPVLSDVKPEQRQSVIRLLALSKYQAKDYAGASKSYRELLNIKSDDLKAYQDASSDDIQSLNNYAFMLAQDLNKPKEALVLAEKAVRILTEGRIDVTFVNNGNIYDTYGWAKFLSGNIEGAITELQRAIQIEPIPLAYVHLAKALKEADRVADARKVLQEGIAFAKAKQDPDLKELEAALQELP